MRLALRVDEVSVLTQVSDLDELAAAPFSCFMEIAPHRQGSIAELFPLASSHHAGQMPAPSWWSDAAITIRAQHLFKVRDAVFFPRWGVVVTAAGEVMRLTMEEAAYASPDLSALPGVSPTSDGLSLHVPAGAERLPRAAAALPFGAMANYGHFLLDGVTGAASLRDAGALARFPLLGPPLKPWQRRHLELLGVGFAETAAEVVRVDEIVYTSCMHHFLHTPNAVYGRVRDAQLARAAAASAVGPRLIYISRGKANARVMAGEAALCRRLAAMGFAVVDPSAMGIDEQIALFHGARAVVGSAGAALANALYCRPGAAVVEIQPEGMENHWVQHLCVVNGLHSATWFCPAVPLDPRHPERGLRHRLDGDAFLVFVGDVLARAGIGVETSRPSLMRRLLDRALGTVGSDDRPR